VPLLKRRETTGRSPERFVLDSPTSPYAEAIRSLHTGLMMTGVERAPKIILVTSALPGEGKTTISLSLARLMASCGKRVVIVDCDLRRCSLSRAFGAQRGAGLSEYLAGDAKLDDVMQQDSLSTTHCVPAGKFANTSPDLFASAAMRRLLETLSAQYDLIVLDCAPVLAVSDARHLCRLADQTVFVVRWQDTRREAAAAALRQMVSAGGRIGGLLLSMVDLDQYGRYSTIGVTQRRIGLYLGN
jgi:capsular exopolysaccharide synthesis family protein